MNQNPVAQFQKEMEAEVTASTEKYYQNLVNIFPVNYGVKLVMPYTYTDGLAPRVTYGLSKGVTKVENEEGIDFCLRFFSFGYESSLIINSQLTPLSHIPFVDSYAEYLERRQGIELPRPLFVKGRSFNVPLPFFTEVGHKKTVDDYNALLEYACYQFSIGNIDLYEKYCRGVMLLKEFNLII